MTDDDRTGDSVRELTEEEMGPPFDFGALVEADEDSPFVARVRRAVHRRLLGSSVVEFCLLGPAVVVLELVLMICSVFRRDEPPEGGNQ